VTDPIARLTAQLAKLPGVGEKTAQRLAFHVLKSPPEYARELAQALLALREEVRLCSSCCNLTAQDPCAICRDSQRDPRMICVVETVPDLLASAPASSAAATTSCTAPSLPWTGWGPTSSS
jgi:recombination protein RecR